MAYEALYRKWRPQDFSGLVGQDVIRTALSEAIKTDRIAHAYLFSGPRGTGKTSTARILAKALNCEHGPTATPCNKCDNCLRINQGMSMDVSEIDAASNRGIDEMRDLRERVRLAPVEGLYKIYIIDEVHMLTTEAFNALLKTLEEPPASVVFILATTEPQKIPATIHSRCQRYDFRRLSIDETAAYLATVAEGSGIRAEKAALQLIAARSDGGMRDALSLLDQCSLADETVTEATVRNLLGLVGREGIRPLAQAIGTADAPGVLRAMRDLMAQGRDVKQVLDELTAYLRAVLFQLTVPDFDEVELTDSRDMLKNIGRSFTPERLMAVTKRLYDVTGQLRWSQQPRALAEMGLIECCYPAADADAALQERVMALEKRVEQLSERVRDGGVADAAVHELALPPKVTEQVGHTLDHAAEKQRPAEVKQAKKTPAPAAREAKPAEMPKTTVESQPTVSPNDLSGIWEQLLKGIEQSKKRSLLACIAQGKVLSLENGQARISFENAFPKERTEKEDYRQVVENILQTITGQPVQLICSIGGSNAVEAQAGQAAQKAKAFFGGKLSPMN